MSPKLILNQALQSLSDPVVPRTCACVLSVSAPLSSYNPASFLCGWCCVTFLNPMIIETLKCPFHRWAESCWVPNVLAPLWVLQLLTQS